MLHVRNVGLKFGGVVALDDASLTVEQGMTCGLIGPNGAGKTTLFNCITRLYQPEMGRLSLTMLIFLHSGRSRSYVMELVAPFRILASFRDSQFVRIWPPVHTAQALAVS